MTLHEAITAPDGSFKSSADISAAIMQEFKAAEQRPRLTCKVCHEQTVLDISFGEQDQICDTCMIKREEWQKHREKQKQFRERQRNSGLPAEFHNHRLTDYDPARGLSAVVGLQTRNGNANVIAQRTAIRDLFLRYCTPEEPNHGALIIGPPGTGKTHLTAALCNRFCYNGHTPKWLDGRELSDLITQDWNYKTRNEMFKSRLADELAAYEIIFIEDLQIPSEKPYDWYVNAVNDIFNQFIVKRRKVFVTTNHRRKQNIAMDGTEPMRDQNPNLWLEKAYGHSFLSRLDGLCGKPLPLTGPDMRVIS